MIKMIMEYGFGCKPMASPTG